MLRRMIRNRLIIVKTDSAETPSQVVFRWAGESGVAREDALELLERLRKSLPFEEDGCLQGSAILDALDRQASLMRNSSWASGSEERLWEAL